ncbi:MAG: hypothetical protein Q7S40_25745 [Opitutaceae bacterium]|nr:hypothetical protein [Opitutaceae bacterium]
MPDSWELVRRAADGSEKIMGRGVLGYDVTPDGSIIYTDGRAVYRCVPDGKPEKLLEHFPIEKIVALE